MSISNIQLVTEADNWRQLTEAVQEGETIVWIEGKPYVLHPASPNDVERINRGIVMD